MVVCVGYSQLKSHAMNNKHHRFFSFSRMRYTLAALCLWAGVTATTTAGDTQVTIWKKQGGSISYALSAKPKITYNATELRLSTNGTTVTYPVADVERITFEAVPSGINPITQQGQGHCLITVTPEGIKIEGTTPKEPVKLYTIDGRLLHTFCTNGQGTLVIKQENIVRHAHAGVHVIVIKAAQSTLKLTLP